MEITSAILKQFFKSVGIPVRVRSLNSFVQVWIQSEPYVNHRDPLVYKYEFPLTFRVKCLEIIYPGMAGNERGNAGNVNPHSISMSREQWVKALEDSKK